MKREAYAVCNAGVSDSATVSNAASTIQIIRYVVSSLVLTPNDLLPSAIQAHSASIVLRPTHLEAASIKGGREPGPAHGPDDRGGAKEQEAGGAPRTEESSMETASKATGMRRTSGVEASKTEERHKRSCNNIQCGKKTSGGSENSSGAQTSTTASYFCDEKDSTASTKMHEMYKSSRAKESSISQFPFQIETVF